VLAKDCKPLLKGAWSWLRDLFLMFGPSIICLESGEAMALQMVCLQNDIQEY